MSISTLPVVALGIGLGVDYTFYIVDGIREELHHNPNVERAIVKALSSAGRGVLVYLHQTGPGFAIDKVDDKSVISVHHHDHGRERDPADAEAQGWMQNAVVVFVPTQNPDGRDRFINGYQAAFGLEPPDEFADGAGVLEGCIHGVLEVLAGVQRRVVGEGAMVDGIDARRSGILDAARAVRMRHHLQAKRMRGVRDALEFGAGEMALEPARLQRMPLHDVQGGIGGAVVDHPDREVAIDLRQAHLDLAAAAALGKPVVDGVAL